MSKKPLFKRSLTDVPSHPALKVSSKKAIPTTQLLKRQASQVFPSSKSSTSSLSEKEQSLRLLKYEFELEEFERAAMRTFWESQIIQLAQEAGESPLLYLQELRECIINHI
jgi:hypothetical protein